MKKAQQTTCSNNKEKTMKLTKMTVIPMMSLLMVACGGGGGGNTSSTPEPVTTVVVEPPVVVVVVEPELEPELDQNAIYDTTAELISAKSFLLKPEYDLSISYKNESNRSAYLSVCTEFTDDENGIKVNYNSCLLRTSIESNFAGTLTVANDKSNLVMAIWYLDDIENPRYETWENDINATGERVFDVN